MLNTKNNQFAGQIPVHRANMATLGQSNYQSLFADYPATKAEILVFPDDSLVLGKNNKRTIEELAELFNPETDLISVVGCSNGTTKLVNGNALLANGRASRVREELIMASIDPTLILEEACWSGAWTSDVPARGVILTLRSRS